MKLSDALRPDPTTSWDRLIDAVDPARMRVRIAARFGLKPEQEDVEEIWRLSLLAVWRDRGSLDWKGVKGLQETLLRVAETEGRERVRNGERGRIRALSDRSGPSVHAGPAPATQPLRAHADREEARAQRRALDRLASELRYLVWLSEYEGLSVEEIARRLELKAADVKRDLRRGLIAFRHKLRELRRERAQEVSEDGV